MTLDRTQRDAKDAEGRKDGQGANSRCCFSWKIDTNTEDSEAAAGLFQWLAVKQEHKPGRGGCVWR